MDVIIDNENKDTAYKPRILGFIHFFSSLHLVFPVSSLGWVSSAICSHRNSSNSSNKSNSSGAGNLKSPQLRKLSTAEKLRHSACLKQCSSTRWSRVVAANEIIETRQDFGWIQTELCGQNSGSLCQKDSIFRIPRIFFFDFFLLYHEMPAHLVLWIKIGCFLIRPFQWLPLPAAPVSELRRGGLVEGRRVGIEVGARIAKAASQNRIPP